MATKTAFTLGRTGKLATSDIYSQLQSAGQRSAIQTSLNADVAKGAPVVRQVSLDPFNPSELTTVVDYPTDAPSYTTARRNADVAAMRETLSPDELVRYWSSGKELAINPALSASPVMFNPVANQAYNTTPQFDWAGRQVAGVGAPQRRDTATDRQMADLKYGRSAQRKNYNDVLSAQKTSAEYAANQMDMDLESQRYYAKPAPRNQYEALDRDRYGSSPDYFYNLQVAGRVDNPYASYFDPRGPNYVHAPSPYQQQVAASEASQHRMSDSFYRRGGHDSPSSFPAGYRL